MGENFYIYNNGKLYRKDNNIEISNKEGKKKNLKIETLENVYVFGEVSMNSKVLNFMAQNKVSMHIFNYYGFYTGSFLPAEKNISGHLLVKQVQHYFDIKKRQKIAVRILKSSSENIYRNLRYYSGRGIEVKKEMTEIKFLQKELEITSNIPELMGIEGNIRKIYYSTWQNIFNHEVVFEKRVKRPPDNVVNSLISFINSILYTTILSEIYKTQLNPTISFLHEPGMKRYSLALDLSEIFKPLIVDRMIFSLINKKQISKKDFEKDSNFVYLKNSGKKVIMSEYEQRLSRTIKHKKLNRKVSYRYLIRLECYKLIKHLIGEQEYEGFTIWW